MGRKRIPMNLTRKFKTGLSIASSATDKFLYRSGLRSAQALPLPDFLGIGFMKSGTTWLSENLRAHPDIFVSDQKELHYFSQNFKKSLASYSAHFADGVDKVKGEVSPSYAVLPENRIRFIHTILPEVRLILLMRNPVEREWSRVVHQIVKQGRDIDAVPEGEMLERLSKSNVHEAGGYSGILDRWQNVFPAEQLFVGLYEDIKTRPKALLTDVFEHLGVATSLEWDTLPYNDVIIPPNKPEHQHLDAGRGISVSDHTNTSRSLPDTYRGFLLERYRADLEELRRRYGERLAGWGVDA